MNTILLLHATEADINGKEIQILIEQYGSDYVCASSFARNLGEYEEHCRRCKPALVLCPRRTLAHTTYSLPLEITGPVLKQYLHRRFNYETLEAVLEDLPDLSKVVRSKAA